MKVIDGRVTRRIRTARYPMSASPSLRHRFLVIDHNPDSRFLLVKTLLRKFQGSHIEETDDPSVAVERAKQESLTAIISHRTTEMLGVELVEKLRGVDLKVPLVMVSGIERTAPALRAGADRFLLYDEWLRIGTVVEELLANPTVRELRVIQVDLRGDR